MAGAWDATRKLTGIEFTVFGHTMSSPVYKETFIDNLELGVIGYFLNFGSIYTGP